MTKAWLTGKFDMLDYEGQARRILFAHSFIDSIEDQDEAIGSPFARDVLLSARKADAEIRRLRERSSNMSRASDYVARLKAAKEAPPPFGPTGNLGDKTTGESCHARVTEHGEACIVGHVNTLEAKRLIQWLRETFDV